MKSVAVLLPLTSRGGVEELEQSLQAFANSLSNTTFVERDRGGLSIKVFLGVDQDDQPLLSPGSDSEKLSLGEAVFSSLPGPPIATELFVFKHPKGSVCRIWRDLAGAAYDQGFELQVLLGDDVILRTPAWISAVIRTFEEIARERSVPLGFGCVALEDRTFPGFPSFPVLHRTHLEANGGEIFSGDFVNQDADPFLFAAYRRFGAARFARGAQLENRVGGAQAARYPKIPTEAWTLDLLDNTVERLDAFLASRGRQEQLGRQAQMGRPLSLDGVRRYRESESESEPDKWESSPVHIDAWSRRVVTLDFGVPSYRVDLRALERILTLEAMCTAPAGLDVTFILVIDNPGAAEATAELVRRHEGNPRVRIRSHAHNLGASAARNRILTESAAEWVLFLDDDVDPDPSILTACLEAIQRHAHVRGSTCTANDPEFDRDLAAPGPTEISDSSPTADHESEPSSAAALQKATKEQHRQYKDNPQAYASDSTIRNPARAPAPVVGFVGATTFPAPVGVFTAAVHLSGCAFFWNAAATWTSDAMPWGVTANLLVRRRHPDSVRFDPIFPKTGGGEDIDFCLQKAAGGGRFVPAPAIRAQHPWWRGGAPDFGRFFGWAVGDGALIPRYPQHTYRDSAPNSIELMGAAVLLAAALLALCLLGRILGQPVGRADVAWPAATLAALAALPAVVFSEILHDVIRYHLFEPRAYPFIPLGSRRRVLASMVGALIRIASESGRLYGLLRRGEFGPSLLLRRFDWFAGLWPPGIAEERRLRLRKFSLFVGVYALLLSPLRFGRRDSF